MYPQAMDFMHLDLAMMDGIKEILDRGEQKAKGGGIFEFRWEKVKIGFYRTLIHRKNVLMREYFMLHSSLENYPYDAETACHKMQEIENRMLAGMDLAPPVVRVEQKRMQADLAAAKKVLRIAIPEKFRSSPGRVYVFEPEHANIVKADVRLEPDSDTESGMACRLFNPDPEKYSLPFTWGVFDRNGRSYFAKAEISAENIFPGKYHWYKLGDSRLSPSSLLYFFQTWHMQWNLSEAFNPLQENKKMEIWANIKFDGKMFGAESGENGVYVERIVVYNNE